MFSTEQGARRILLLVCAVQLAVGVLVPLTMYGSLPLDVGENMVWGHAWQIGYAKHPPLQAWLTEIGRRAAFGHVVGVYVMAQLVICVAHLGLFALARRCSGPQAAALSVIILAANPYVSVLGEVMNADTVQLPIWTWSGWMLWRAVEDGRLRHWIGLGILLALAVYAKYTAAFLIVSLVGVALLHPAGRRHLKTIGPYVTAAVTLALILPHVLWVIDHDYLPIRYAQRRALPIRRLFRPLAPFRFLIAQAATFIVPLLVVAALGGRKAPAAAVSPQAQRYVDVLAVAPLLAMALYSAVAGQWLIDVWGLPACVFLPLALALRIRIDAPVRRQALAMITVVVAFIAIPVGVALYGLSRPILVGRAFVHNLPMRDVTQQVQRIWGETYGGEPQVLVGSIGLTGSIAYFLQQRPEVLIDGVYAYCPWIAPDLIGHKGAMVLWSGGPPPATGLRFDREGVIRVPMGRTTMEVNYGLIAPEQHKPTL